MTALPAIALLARAFTAAAQKDVLPHKRRLEALLDEVDFDK